MRHFLILLKVRIISQVRLNTLKGKASIGDKMVIIGILLPFVIVLAYITGLAYMLNEYNMREHILAYSFLLSTVLSLFFAFFSASDELFGKRDYDTLMSLPIKTSIIVVSRFFYIYFLNTVVSLIIMLLMGAVYFSTGTVNGVFWIKILIGILTVSLVPSIVASIVSILVLEASSRLKYSRAVSSISYMCIILFLVLAPTLSGYKLDPSDMKLILTNILNQFNQVYPMFYLYNKILVTGTVGDFLIYIAVSLVLTVIFIIGLSFVYKRLNTKIRSMSSNKKYEVKTLKRSSILKALYIKEIKRLFSSTTYIMNKVFGMIMMVIFTISLMISITKVMENMPIDNINTVEILYGVTPYIMSLMVCLSNTSSVSFSLEGKNIWIIKTFPLSKELVVKSKILVNLTVTIPLTIINGIIIGRVFGATLFDSIILVLLPCAFAVFSAIYGVAINLRFVNYSWQSELQVVKQSVSSLLGMFGGIILVLIAAVPKVLWSGSIAGIYDVVTILILSIVTSMLYAKTINGEPI
ncbi:hypothetical protein B1B04_16940 [Lysinibacillus sp. KCTC 33748]|uniref:hypothetical protein n=1 Tax=unclassified Lysinibacillus TaxID=2636778 RepID=UPI0009A774E5|nr:MULTISPECIES: hypothetical protein [unclassified Lysinibacillus]OXS72192.1 hypothetical protein B1B04_16940 [Lysinibacillus sp. KCTC 33748]SKB98322.1 ABC-2 type transport system permease protein [Lysinibacillus sp. AC-3]